MSINWLCVNLCCKKLAENTPVTVNSPITGCLLTTTEAISVEVMNSGVDTITSVDVCYSIDGGSVLCETVAISISPDSTETVNLVATMDLSAAATYSVQIVSSHAEDNSACNDTLVVSVTNTLNGVNTPTALEGCDSLSFNGMMYFTSTMVSDTTLGGTSGGCDSITNQQIIINTVDVSVTNSSPVLTANATSATYQWLDCDNGNAVISSATNQNYTPTVNGNYAVEVTVGSCVDTSACENVSNVGFKDINGNQAINIYPNPTKGVFMVLLPVFDNTTITIYSVVGQQVSHQKIVSNNTKIDLSNNKQGVYLVKITNQQGSVIKRLVKE